MTKGRRRRLELLNLLRNQGTGIINISNLKLAALCGVSISTVKRDLDALNGLELIIRETNLINRKGETLKQRDIILKDELPRRFSINQHRNLSDKKNHRIYTNEFGEVIWLRRPNGEETYWERCMEDKEFESTNQALSWLYSTVNTHHKKYTEGDRYTSRSE